MNTFRIDLYTGRHQELRAMLFALSLAMGTCAWRDDQALKAVSRNFYQVMHEVREHARHENTYLHPVIAPKVARMKFALEEEHQEHEQELLGLEELLKTLSAEDKEKRSLCGLELYRALNRFIARDLLHMDEEEYLMQNLWELCTPAELFAVMVSFKALEEPAHFLAIKELCVDQLSQTEQKTMLELICALHGEHASKHIEGLLR